MGYSVREEILGLRPYKAGKPISEVKRELGLDEVIKLASNENPLGTSPKAKQAIKSIIDESQMYPDASNYELKNKLAKKYGVKHEQIFCGEGSDALIRCICEVFLKPGEESIMAEVTFPRYESATKLMGGKCIKIPMKDNGLDIEAMVSAITERTRIIWFCNPNNPTGTIFKKDEFEALLKKIPEDVIIVMDEAYIEYVTDKDFPDSLNYINDYPNMISLRTFSKAYGLASLRVGYGIANEEIVTYLNRVIGPFDVNLYAQVAAVAALDDEEFIKKVYDTNNEGKEYLYEQFKEMNLPYIDTNSNFIMVNTKASSEVIFDKLLRQGMIVRPGHLLGMPGWLRVTIGTMEQNKKFIECLKNSL
ncbi:histidinol-phosphate aminotransferase 2 [Clostridium tepidiprofundi DSM 19306]|uniref:Histidinol-phosphate aminotransferase n=1 Tax=Clostridium tepidiprofundi DSM 19306 TaxID=1121338 RepID=A0A151B6G6_9CLOT|nr:histidinol-phosphate transaminase [Clostridium tepidiprofundi]KYH35393.1 histidinol-phosphate aminotransferase 2 [Clostridium tepidiprofundi DSM 19306]